MTLDITWCCHDMGTFSASLDLWWGTVQWRHNGRNGVSNHQPHDCLLNRVFRRRSKKTPKFRFNGLCARNSPVTSSSLPEIDRHVADDNWTYASWRPFFRSQCDNKDVSLESNSSFNDHVVMVSWLLVLLHGHFVHHHKVSRDNWTYASWRPFFRSQCDNKDVSLESNSSLNYHVVMVSWVFVLLHGHFVHHHKVSRLSVSVNVASWIIPCTLITVHWTTWLNMIPLFIHWNHRFPKYSIGECQYKHSLFHSV